MIGVHKVIFLDIRSLKAYQKVAARTLYRKKMGNANKAEACIGKKYLNLRCHTFVGTAHVTNCIQGKVNKQPKATEIYTINHANSLVA